jgi:dTDP-4-amino-4,6-dideoxygalactose transaminase
MGRIPVLDLAPEIEELWDELNAAIQRVLRGGHFILGPDVAAFEAEAARYLGVRHAVGLNSGTDALLIGLEALGVGPGDEVVTSPFTFFATAEAILRLGAVPVFADIDPATFNLDPAGAAVRVTERTRALLPVHLYGHAADMGPLRELARRHGLKVLEDVAQAMGGEHGGRRLGALGDAGALSFFPSKTLGACGDAGLLATDDDAVAERARMLQAHGARRKYHNESLGYNSRLDTIQAAILRVKLPRLEAFIAGRRAAAARYHELLAGLEGIGLPSEAPGVRHAWHQYTVRIAGGRRDAVKDHLAAAEIDTMVYYPVPVHRLPACAGLSGPLPVSERLAGEVLSLPLWPQIRPETQERVAAALRAALEQDA